MASKTSIKITLAKTITVPPTFDGKTLLQPEEVAPKINLLHDVTNYIFLLRDCGLWTAKAVQIGYGQWILIGYNYNKKLIEQNRITNTIANQNEYTTNQFAVFARALLDKGQKLVGLIEDPCVPAGGTICTQEEDN
jgi:hypothetical protein